MLSNGSPLPTIEATDLEGTTRVVTDFTDGSWSAVLFYRGHW